MKGKLFKSQLDDEQLENSEDLDWEGRGTSEVDGQLLGEEATDRRRPQDQIPNTAPWKRGFPVAAENAGAEDTVPPTSPCGRKSNLLRDDRNGVSSSHGLECLKHDQWLNSTTIVSTLELLSSNPHL